MSKKYHRDFIFRFRYYKKSYDRFCVDFDENLRKSQKISKVGSFRTYFDLLITLFDLTHQAPQRVIVRKLFRNNYEIFHYFDLRAQSIDSATSGTRRGVSKVLSRDLRFIYRMLNKRSFALENCTKSNLTLFIRKKLRLKVRTSRAHPYIVYLWLALVANIAFRKLGTQIFANFPVFFSRVFGTFA